MMRWLVLITVLLVVGCNGLTPNKAAVITSDTLLSVAQQVDLAHARGHISDEDENRLINNLIAGQELIAGVYTTAQVPGCTADQSKQECLQVVLVEIEARLREAQQ